MPGNEVGDSIHNFIGQESLSPGQHHSQLVDSTWPGVSNNLCFGSQRQVGHPASNVKNFSGNQLVEFDRGHSGQISSLQHGLNFTQSGMRPEITRNQFQNQSSIANGYTQGHQAFQARQNETNFLGVTASRGLSVLDSHMKNGPDLHEKNSFRPESTESPINYNFLGGQQQVNGQHPGMIQPLPRQESGMTDMQLLQQQSILKQMQEFQRHQLLNPQFQLLEARQLSSVNQISSFVKQGSENLSPAPINGVPVHDASNYSWQPELMTPNANWLQHDGFSAMPGSSGGFIFSPVQGQERLMGLVPQQDNQSINGVFNSGARGNPYQYLSVQMDKPLSQQVPASSNSFPGNQFAMFSEQVGLQDGTLVSRQGDQARNAFGASALQGSNNVFNSENLQQATIQPKNIGFVSHGRQEHLRQSETSLEKSEIQAVHSQNVASLDPTEEKILFGSDDSVWDIFGKNSNMGAVLDGTDSFGEFPSMQSGSWSALMQSAVAETSSNDVGVLEEWNGLAVQSSEPPSGNMPSSIVTDGSKQQLPGVDNNLQNASTLNSKWLGHSALQKSVVESAQLFGNVARSPDVQASAKSSSGHQSMPVFNAYGQPYNKENGWNFIESASRGGGAISKSQDIESSSQPSHRDHRGVPFEERSHVSDLDCPVQVNIGPWNVNTGLGSPKVNMEGSDPSNVAALTDMRTIRVKTESSLQHPNGHNLNLWKNIDSNVNFGLSRGSSKYQQNLDKSPQSFDSSRNNCLDTGMSEANMEENTNAKDTSNDSFRSNLSHHTSTGGIIDNGWLDANDPRAVEQKSSVHVSSHNFQYHPIWDPDVEVEPSYGTKNLSHMQAIAQHVSQGMKGSDQGYFARSNYTGHAAGESSGAEKGCFPGIQVDEVPSKSSNSGSAPDRSFGNFMLNKTTSISQNMLELLQKVDQPREPCTATHLSSSERNQSSEMPDAETSDGSVGQFQQYRHSAAQSFGLQLGPPSQRFTIPDRPALSQSSPQGINSINSVHTTSELGRKGHALLGPTTSVQSTHGAFQGDIRNNIPSISGHTNHKASQRNISGNVSVGFTPDYPYLKSHIQRQLAMDVSNQVIQSKHVNAHFSELASQSKQNDDSFERAQISQSGRISAPHTPETAADNDFASSETSWPRCSSQNHARDLDQQFPVLEAMSTSQPSAMSESSRQGAFNKMPNVWTSVSAAQHLLGAQSSWASQNLLKRHQQSNVNSETALPGAKKPDDQIASAGGSGQTEFPAGSAKPQNSVGGEQPAKGQQLLQGTDASQNLASVQRHIEAFGHSLRPNNIVHQKYSLLHQMQAMKNIDIDPSNRSAKRFKGPTPESSLDAQQVSQGADQLPYGFNNMTRDALVNCPIVPSGDSKMLSLSSNAGDNHETQLSANDTMPFAQNGSVQVSNANNSAASLRGEHSQIRPRLAPSWFDRHGALKNGIYDARKIAMMKATDKAFIIGRPSDSLHALDSDEQVNDVIASQLADARQNSNHLPMGSEHISRHLLPPCILNQNLIDVSAKKCKSMTFELVSWHREVTQGCRRPQNISETEAEWAHSANRLIEKVEYEPEMVEDWSPVPRSKRRLILTTQLMQQLLCAPPSRAVLSADARKYYGTMVYFVARLGLGEACSTAYILESDTAVPSESGSTLSEKLKERTQTILKAAEEFVVGTKKLENDLQSLEKRASILDLRLECHDLEKVSLINRFAKFYGRGQADRVETSSSSEAISSPPKSFLQRYVSALQMPRNLPDKVQCLSL